MTDPREGTQRPHVIVVEQPVSETRFRYPIEGRGAGVLKGEHSRADLTTFPKIKIVGYEGPAVVVVSCVTHDSDIPRAHPHNLVSPATVNNKESCKKGVYHTTVNSQTMTVEFSHLGVQCVRKKDIKESLKKRQKIRVDPYKQGFDHVDNPKGIDLNAIKLCFQVFIEKPSCPGRFTGQLAPVCSRTIYSARVMSQLQIIDLSDNRSTACGGRKLILVCEKVSREDIKIRLSDGTGWEGWAHFLPSDVHKQCAITFRTPPYRDINITEEVRLSLELVRPSDGATSDEEEFFFTPSPGLRASSRRNDLDYDGRQLLDITSDLELNIPVSPISLADTNLTNYQILSQVDQTIDALAESETDDLINLSDIMKDLGLKPAMPGMKRSSKDAENDSASLSLLTKIGGTAQATDLNSNLYEYLNDCFEINDL